MFPKLGLSADSLQLFFSYTGATFGSDWKEEKKRAEKYQKVEGSIPSGGFQIRNANTIRRTPIIRFAKAIKNMTSGGDTNRIIPAKSTRAPIIPLIARMSKKVSLAFPLISLISLSISE
ncbi:MAG: hypothetical protein CVT47_04050 [Thermoplasmata archaeon HGW-Thermoplasmata-2]|nr:MAG: hypothetical protein CVT47_04050 [Thermoplasmata archaeon HGW-Thermoplasmata-2]